MKELLRLQAGLASIWPELPTLLGDAFLKFESELLPLLRAVEAQPLETARLDAVYVLLESYEAVYDRLLEVMGTGSADFRGTSLAKHSSVGRFVTVPVWYATDRKRTGSSAPKGFFGGDRGSLAYGRVEVSIPDIHDKGKLEKPRLLRLEFRENPE